jgi:hypothetical protein
MEPSLRAANQTAVLVIATDGESSDGDVTVAMRPLQHLPVHVVIRLCTGEERIMDYWNNIDKSLGNALYMMNVSFIFLLALMCFTIVPHPWQ